jgi:chemotaxis protein CheY-P-specific phosphatase CheC
MSNVAIEHIGSTIHDHIYLPPQEIERLYEAAQIGASGSISSLRQFLGINTDIKLNCLSFLSLPVLIDRINRFYHEHLGFHIRFSGDITGEIFTFFGLNDALVIIDQITGRRRRLFRPKQLNKIETSVLAELVNIISNSFWRALTEKTAINWWISPPAKVNDLERSLFYTTKIYSVDSLMVQIEYLIPALQIRIYFVILPTQYTLKKILTRLANPTEK